jgi:hypothetical protein
MFKDKIGDYKLKIAFDYDDTLTDPFIFELAKRLIRCGHDVWIMTARSSYEQYLEKCDDYGIIPKSKDERNIDLMETASKLGIEDKIVYTNLDDKKDAFMSHKFDLLFDDDADWHCNPICEAGGIAVNI